uniref:Putative secreted protein n=1 Tax=Anopheles marajoara TaxID=58244 RepID=A0A2M4CBA6_9DIPT
MNEQAAAAVTAIRCIIVVTASPVSPLATHAPIECEHDFVQEEGQEVDESVEDDDEEDDEDVDEDDDDGVKSEDEQDVSSSVDL